MDLGLKGKTIIVTGAASGIGASIYKRLLEDEEACPIGIDIIPWKDSELHNLHLPDIHDINSLPDNGKFHEKKDASNLPAMQDIISNISDIYGLVNNAGKLGSDRGKAPHIGGWNEMINSHAKSAYILTELSRHKMNDSKKKDGGSIINIGSIDIHMAPPDTALYIAAKGALWGLTLAYSITLARKNIRVNMISPGHVDTENNKKQFINDKRLVEGFKQRTPLRRVIKPDEIANIVLFLLSCKSLAITGEEIIVDCGYTKALWDPEWAPNKF